MKIAFFSPLNPIQSGISDYSEELLLALRGAKVGSDVVDIDLFLDKGYKPSSSEITERFDVLPGRGFGRMAGQYDAAVYQMGNSHAHAYIYDELMRHPGVVVMHEFVLHHLRIWMAINRAKGGGRKRYEELMGRKYGEEGREAARRVMLGQFPDALFSYPLSDEVIYAAKGIIVHSRYMEGLVREVRPDVPLAVVPMGVPLPPLIPKEAARARLGFPPDLFLVTSAGHLNPYKRVSTTLRAFKALLMEKPNSLYLLVGSRSPNYDPTPQIEMLGLSDKVKSTGYVSQEEFALFLAASDVCLNLRYPTAGETSASLLRIMGAGVPVLVSRTGSFEELPDGAAGKIDTGDIEEELLLEYMLLLSHRPDLREAMSHEARRFVAEHHTLEGAARGYLRFLTTIAGTRPRDETASIELAAGAMAAPIDVSKLLSQPVVSVNTPNVDVGVGVVREPLRQDVLTDEGEAYSLTGIVAEAAAEIGLEEVDTPVLTTIAQALSPLVMPKRDNAS